MEVLPETVTEVVKKGRGRPRKEKIETEPTETPKKRGRPKTEINISEIREKMELQNQINISEIMEKIKPKTNLTADKNYYTQWYSNHYKGVCMTCPSCMNPNINVAKIHRHVRTYKCLRDTMLKTYSENDI